MSQLHRSIVASVFIGLSGFGLSACGSGYGSPSPVPTTGTGTTITVPSGVTAFSPTTLTVDVGTTVVWQNKDGATTHTTTSDSGAWNSTLGPGQEFSRTFSTAGTFAYHCTVHAGMTGTVVVK